MGTVFGGLWEEAVKRIPVLCVRKVRCGGSSIYCEIPSASEERENEPRVKYTSHFSCVKRCMETTRNRSTQALLELMCCCFQMHPYLLHASAFVKLAQTVQRIEIVYYV